MSRSSRAKRPALFRNRHRATCPDCIERGALDGRAIGSHPRQYCETCKGQGRVTFVDVIGSWPPGDPWVWRGGR